VNIVDDPPPPVQTKETGVATVPEPKTVTHEIATEMSEVVVVEEEVEVGNPYNEYRQLNVQLSISGDNAVALQC